MSANVEDMLGNPAGARQFLDEAEAIAADADDYLATIELIQAQTVHAFFGRDMEAVTAKSAEGASLSRDAGDPLLLGSMLRNLATVRSEMSSLAATCLLLRPSATNWATSTSRRARGPVSLPCAVAIS